MKIRAGASGDAVRRPGRRIIRLVGEMVTRVDVEVFGRHDVVVTGLSGQIVVDSGGQGGTAGHCQRAPSQKSFCTSTMINARTRSTISSSGQAAVQGAALLADQRGNPPSMLIRRIARPLLSAVFVGQGVDSLLNPKSAAEAAAPTVDGLRALPDPVGSNIPGDAQTFAQITAAVQIGGGILLATGKMPRLASAALAFTVLPANLGAHMFWNETDPQRKAEKRQAFLTDLSLLGGLMIAVGRHRGQAVTGVARSPGSGAAFRESVLGAARV